MKTSLYVISVLAIAACTTIGQPMHEDINLISDNFEFAEKQTQLMLETVGEANKSPRNSEEDGSLRLVPSSDWTSGFFPGNLWYIYEFSKDKKWKTAAEKFTQNIEDQQWNGGTHDMGFKMYCSFGNGYRLTANTEYQKILIQSAKTLITRYNPIVGCLKSWDHNADKWQFPVIIDNMMNLELLFWATKATGDSSYYQVAVSHVNTTLKNHFHENFASYHVVNYDTLTGKVINKQTHQGYAHESAWARGQAWGLYGFTMAYRETGNEQYLIQAKNIANFIFNNPNLPADLIPYWDFDAPNIPNETRDASAAAIICSALYELSTYSPERGDQYVEKADQILRRLSHSYRSKIDENNHFLLTQSTGNKPKGSEINVPIVYADYYWLEANLRKLKLAQTDFKN